MMLTKATECAKAMAIDQKRDVPIYRRPGEARYPKGGDYRLRPYTPNQEPYTTIARPEETDEQPTRPNV